MKSQEVASLKKIAEVASRLDVFFHFARMGARLQDLEI